MNLERNLMNLIDEPKDGFHPIQIAPVVKKKVNMEAIFMDKTFFVWYKVPSLTIFKVRCVFMYDNGLSHASKAYP